MASFLSSLGRFCTPGEFSLAVPRHRKHVHSAVLLPAIPVKWSLFLPFPCSSHTSPVFWSNSWSSIFCSSPCADLNECGVGALLSLFISVSLTWWLHPLCFETPLASRSPSCPGLHPLCSFSVPCRIPFPPLMHSRMPGFTV